jgi:hypothetical protein
MSLIRDGDDLVHLDDALWLIRAPVGTPNYDFAFENLFPCRHPWQAVSDIVAVARVGAIEAYPDVYARLQATGIRLVHTPHEYSRCTELPTWYPLLLGLTPESYWFNSPPPASEVEARLSWPVFVKGERQTSRHQKSLSIIKGPDEFDRAMRAYREDPILRWQRVVCRRYVPLRPVAGDGPADRVPRSFEFRTFWWKGNLVGIGRYWFEGQTYTLSSAEEADGLTVAREAARRLQVPFPVIDIAQTAEGRWIVIECNDGQESGYAGVMPIGLWQRVIEIERGRQ